MKSLEFCLMKSGPIDDFEETILRLVGSKYINNNSTDASTRTVVAAKPMNSGSTAVNCIH